MTQPTAFVFDLDGTLVDSVYPHVAAWAEAAATQGIAVPSWRLHRRIGLRGDLFARALLHDAGRKIEGSVIERLQAAHAEAYQKYAADVALLPGAKDLLRRLKAADCPFAIATSGKRASAEPMLDRLDPPDDVPIVTGDDADAAKPAPDLFLIAAERLGLDPQGLYAVGDSVWDMLAAKRAGMVGIGVLTGGFGAAELVQAGANLVYDDAATLADRLYETGIAA